jgi:hypothetical protein
MKITRKSSMRTIEAKAFRAFISTYSLFKSKRLSANIRLTLQKALIRSLRIYICSSWVFEAFTHLLKLQRLQNKDIITIGDSPRHTPNRELHKGFNIPYIYDYLTKVRSQQAEAIQNHGNNNVRKIEQGTRWQSSVRKFKCLACCCSLSHKKLLYGAWADIVIV